MLKARSSQLYLQHTISVLLTNVLLSCRQNSALFTQIRKKKSYVIWIFPTELTLGTRKMKFSPCWRKHFAQTVCVQNQEKSIFLAPNSLNVPLTFEKLPKPCEISFQSHFFSVHTKCSSWQLHWNVSDQNQSTKSFLWEPQKEYIIYSKNDFVNQILWTSRI